MTVMIVTIVVTWVLFSTLMVTVICMNSSRLSRIDEPFKDPSQVYLERLNKQGEMSPDHPAAFPAGAET
jgi:hypothetical protein